MAELLRQGSDYTASCHNGTGVVDELRDVVLDYCHIAVEPLKSHPWTIRVRAGGGGKFCNQKCRHASITCLAFLCVCNGQYRDICCDQTLFFILFFILLALP